MSTSAGGAAPAPRDDPEARWGRFSGAALILCLCTGQALAGPPGAEMRGTVMETGTLRTLTGAVAMLSTGEEGAARYLTSTDSDGRFEFHGLPAAAYTLEVSLPGYRVGRKGALQVRPPFRSIVALYLERGAYPGGAEPAASPGAAAGGTTTAPAGGAAEGGPAGGATLTVTLSDRERKPIPEGLVAVVPVDGEGERRYGRTDAAGRIEFESLPPRRYRLTAGAPGYLTVRSERIALGGSAPASVVVILTPYPLNFAGSLDDLLPPDEPLLPRRLKIDAPEAQPGRTP